MNQICKVYINGEPFDSPNHKKITKTSLSIPYDITYQQNIINDY